MTYFSRVTGFVGIAKIAAKSKKSTCDMICDFMSFLESISVLRLYAHVYRVGFVGHQFTNKK